MSTVSEAYHAAGTAVPAPRQASDARRTRRASSCRCPALTSSEAIADILSAYDDLIENNRRRMALLEEAARQLYREWFVRLRFPGHEHTRITNGVPEGWERRQRSEHRVRRSKRRAPLETIGTSTAEMATVDSGSTAMMSTETSISRLAQHAVRTGADVRRVTRRDLADR